MKQKRICLQREINKSTTVIGFHSLSLNNLKKNRQKIIKDIDLNNNVKHLIDIYRTFHPEQ